MSSATARQYDPEPLEALNEEAYRRLLRVVDASRGMFALILVESALSGDQSEQIFARLRQDMVREEWQLVTAELSYQSWDPVEVLEQAQNGPREPAVVLLRGLERTPPAPFADPERRRPPAFARLNQARELIRRRFPAPLIVWCEAGSFSTLRRHAPDFFDHFAGLVRFHGSASQATEPPPRERGEIQTQPLPLPPAPESGLRFFEARLERVPKGSPEHVQALLGLAESLLGLRGTEHLAAASRAAAAVEQALESLSLENDAEQWARAKDLEALASAALNRLELALSANEQAVDIRRQLAKARPDAFLPYLATSLNGLGNRLSELGRREEALKATREAIELRRQLAEARPDAFLPDLAASLHNLGDDLGALDRLEEALEATSEAVATYKRLAKAQPGAFLSDLAMSLNNLGSDLSALGRREEALETTSEAVERFRQLAKAHPDTFLPNLAGSLNNLGNRLSELGQREEAFEAAEESVRLLLPFCQRFPDKFREWMVTWSHNYAEHAADLGQEPDAELLRQVAKATRR